MSTCKVNDPLSDTYEFSNCCLICHSLSLLLQKIGFNDDMLQKISYVLSISWMRYYLESKGTQEQYILLPFMLVTFQQCILPIKNGLIPQQILC
jgi:hypothetical protein